MKIFTSEQIKKWDQTTIAKEPIPSIELMERAARMLFHWFDENVDKKVPIYIFCGPGNNGGDGLALARMLWEISYEVKVYVLESKNYSLDSKINQRNLPKEIKKVTITKKEDLPNLEINHVVIDALFGIGLNKPLEGISIDLVNHINLSGSLVISIDLPSGLYANQANEKDDAIIESDVTLTFQLPKLSFLLPQQGGYAEQWQILPIGLLPSFYEEEASQYQFITQNLISQLQFDRDKFSYKNQFGHALLIAGSYGMMGAASLTTQSCMRSGVGLTTAYIPTCGYSILQTSCPEAIVRTPNEKDGDQILSTFPEDTNQYQAIGIGPGLGTSEKTAASLKEFLKKQKNPLVLDADALNILSEDKSTFSTIPPFSILTPHIGEFSRMTEVAKDDYHRLELVKEFSQKYNVIVVLKGAYSVISLPSGSLLFNSTGNPGMATAGSGDVLTGVITGLLAQGYHPEEAVILGVYKHGLAGDKAVEKTGQEALIASDILTNLR